MIRKLLITMASATLICSLAMTSPMPVHASDADDDIEEITDSSDTEDSDSDGDDDDDSDDDSDDDNNNTGPDNSYTVPDTGDDLGSVDTDDSGSGSSYSRDDYSGYSSYDSGSEHVKDDTPETADISIEPKFILAASMLLAGFALLLFGRRGITVSGPESEPEGYDDSLD